MAVSKAKIIRSMLTFRGGSVDVLERNGDAGFGEPVSAVLGPFDEGDRAVEVRLEVPPLLGIEPGEAIEIEVRDGHRAAS